ncbi:glycosyltransferase family 9 protein [Pseudonocardia broussonetiae]|nr:glycosyltransferase family 9 protein [Pseudonocardia broussonetiae]
MPADDRPVQLVLRALHLGDLLVAVPALRGLRRARPGHRLVLAAPAALAPLVALTGAVDDLLPTAGPDALRWDAAPPDVAVNLHGAGPESHRALDATGPRVRIGYAAPGWPGPEWDGPREDPLGLADLATGDLAAAELDAGHLGDDELGLRALVTDPPRPEQHERERWCGMLAAFDVPADPDDLLLAPPPAVTAGTPPTVVHPGAAYGSKRWPAERFAEVAAALADAGHRVVLTGAAGERELAAQVAVLAGLPPTAVLAGRTDLAQLAALVAGAALVVSGDTGIAHLASAFRTPSVVLFGPVPPQRWGPPATGPHVVLTGADRRRGEPFADDPDPALLAVEVPDVLAAAASVVGARAGR